MAGIKNSEFLNRLIEYAKNYGGEAAPLTAGRYLLAVIDALVEKLISENHISGDEIAEIFEKYAVDRPAEA